MRLSYLLLLLFLTPILSYAQLDNDGWTILTPSSTTKIIYVSASDGDDLTGETYTSANSEIGSDPFLPSGVIMPFKTIEAAATNIDDGEGGWILLKRGDTFFESLVSKSSASKNNPMLYASYGSSNEQPLLKTGRESGISACCRSTTNFWVVGISFYAHTRNPKDADYINGDGSSGFSFYCGEGHKIDNILIEGCVFRFYVSNVMQGAGLVTDIKLRRNVILNNYGTTGQGHSQGLYGSHIDGILLEENIFDHNGWYKQSINSDNDKADGQATIFNHNTYFADNHNVTFTGNTFLRPSSIGTKWTANTGVASTSNLTLTNNFYYDYEVGISLGGNEPDLPYRFKNVIVSENVFDQPNVSMQTNRDLGWMIEIIDWDNGVLSDNLFVHQKLSERTNCYGIKILGENRNLTIRDNILYNLMNSDYFTIGDSKLGVPHFINSSIYENELTFPSENEEYFVDSYRAVDNSLFSNNTYSNAQDYNEAFRIDTDRISYNEWISSAGESGSITTPPTYPDPSRSFDRYVTEVLGLSSVEDFYIELRNQSKLNWRLGYTAQNINEWIKEGFAVGTEAPGIITSTIPNSVVNQDFNYELEAFGGNGELTWSLTEGNLPTGLSLSETGNISGIPTEIGETQFTITVTDSNGNTDSQNLTITILATSLPVINTVILKNGGIDNSYYEKLIVEGEDAPFTWNITSGNLPNGLSLTKAGEISGIPTAIEETTFTITVTDSNGDEDSQILSLEIVHIDVPSIITKSLAIGIEGTLYSEQLIADGSDVPLIWTITNGSLPDGLSLSESGEISGTPTLRGRSTFTVKVEDQNGDEGKETKELTITIVEPNLPYITTEYLPKGVVGINYSEQLMVEGGTAPFTWSTVPEHLPEGLSLSASGEISGIPTKVDTNTFTVTVRDNNGKRDSQIISIEISDSEANAPNITTTNLANGVVDVAYTQQLTAEGGNAPLIWSIKSGNSLPSGLSLSESGVIHGIPSTDGQNIFTVVVVDKDGDRDEQQLNITISKSDVPVITTIDLPEGLINTVYTQNLTASASNGMLVWSISNGFLPEGLVLSETGEISGTPTTLGTATFTVTVSDSEGNEDSQEFTITIISECTDISVNAGNDTTITSGETVVLNAISNSDGTFNWQPSAGLNDSSSASPTANPTITTTYTVTFTDANGCTAEDSMTITVNPLEETSMKYGFSPNNDGINDYWEITGIEQYPDNVVQIFNRWGNLVFETKGYNNSSIFFDGYANRSQHIGANELPDGTYFFKINIHGEHSLTKTEGFLIIKR